MIDPIDGTTNYLYGHPGFAISIAVEREGDAVVGVVDDPLHGDVLHRRSAVAAHIATASRSGVSAETELGVGAGRDRVRLRRPSGAATQARGRSRG